MSGPDDDERPALSLDSRFFAAGPVDWVELHELLDSSFRRIALRRQLVALDSRTGAPPPPIHAGGAAVATPSPNPNQTQIPIQPTEPP
ncbi:MAG: hypothetical protein H7269_14320 [Cellulomonas sp.]|nr:hypothetical protein [Cellulomonas sp.]